MGWKTPRGGGHKGVLKTLPLITWLPTLLTPTPTFVTGTRHFLCPFPLDGHEHVALTYPYSLLQQ